MNLDNHVDSTFGHHVIMSVKKTLRNIYEKWNVALWKIMANLYDCMVKNDYDFLNINGISVLFSQLT